MTYTYTRARTKTACRVVGIDRQKLTDAINTGDYGCAPSTTAGVARVFDVDDMTALFFYERLTARGVPSRRAGGVACLVLGQMRNDPAAERIVIAWTFAGNDHVASEKDWSVGARNAHHGTPLLYTEIYDVGNVRKLITERLAEEGTIAGAADE